MLKLIKSCKTVVIQQYCIDPNLKSVSQRYSDSLTIAAEKIIFEITVQIKMIVLRIMFAKVISKVFTTEVLIRFETFFAKIGNLKM